MGLKMSRNYETYCMVHLKRNINSRYVIKQLMEWKIGIKLIDLFNDVAKKSTLSLQNLKKNQWKGSKY